MSTNARAEIRGTRVLEAADVSRAWDAVHDLSRELSSWQRWTDRGVAVSGWWGGSILHLTYHHRLEPSTENEKTIEELFDAALTAAAKHRYFAFYGGLSGLGWGLEHVSRMLGDEIDLDDLDQYLLAAVEKGIVRDHELIGGLAGVGFYGLERAHCEGGRRVVTAVVETLERQSRLQIDGVSWHKGAEFIADWQRDKLPNGCWNLGLSHGMPGVISLLAFALRENICADISAHLLEQSVPWLVKQYFQIGSRWHVASTVEGPRPERSRLAWCYNELGTTMPILNAAEAMKRDDWRTFAADVLHSLESVSFKESGVYDTGETCDPAICHGIAGVAHLFAHGARELNDESLAATARGWMTTLLDARSQKHGVAGFPGIGAPDKVTQVRPVTDDPGFLEGASGVGLVLLAALADETPGWNRLLGM